MPTLSEIRVLPAEPADLPDIAALQAESWRRTYRGAFPAGLLGDPLEEWLERKWRPERLEGWWLLAAWQEGRIAGFAAARPEADADAYLDNIHVRPGLKGRGIGRALMAGIAERAGARPIRLNVLEANHPARAIYRAWGGQEGPVFEDELLGVPVPARTVRWSDAASLARRLVAGQGR
jgi:ribosomal protein S18 acetylase RimI-like enzyme